MQYVSPIATTKLNSARTMFITLVKINDCRLIAMINSSATSNFMIKALIKREEYFT